MEQPPAVSVKQDNTPSLTPPYAPFVNPVVIATLQGRLPVLSVIPALLPTALKEGLLVVLFVLRVFRLLHSYLHFVNINMIYYAEHRKWIIDSGV